MIRSSIGRFRPLSSASRSSRTERSPARTRNIPAMVRRSSSLLPRAFTNARPAERTPGIRYMAWQANNQAAVASFTARFSPEHFPNSTLGDRAWRYTGTRSQARSPRSAGDGTVGRRGRPGSRGPTGRGMEMTRLIFEKSGMVLVWVHRAAQQHQLPGLQSGTIAEHGVACSVAVGKEIHSLRLVGHYQSLRLVVSSIGCSRHASINCMWQDWAFDSVGSPVSGRGPAQPCRWAAS